MLLMVLAGVWKASVADPLFGGYQRGGLARMIPTSLQRTIAMLPRLLCGLLFALFALPNLAPASEPTPYLSMQAFVVGDTTFLRGTTRRISGIIQKCSQQVPGCPSNFARSSLYYRLPPGVSYVSHYTYAPIFPATCTVAAMPDGSEHVVCTGGGLGTGIYTNGQVELTVAVASDAPLGSARLVMAVDDSLPDESNTLDECLDDTFPNYCDERMLTIGVAPAADLFIDVVNHSPTVFEPDDTTAVVRVSLFNRGNAPTAGTHLQAQLPPGFQWQLATTSTGAFAMTCAKTGSWNSTGETVTCSGGALAASRGTDIVLGIRPRDNMEVPGPLPVVIAVNDGASADPAVLLACANDPSPAQCAWHEVPTFIACARQHGADGIFCDGFEVLNQPAQFLATPAEWE